jgi:hypothetical protein
MRHLARVAPLLALLAAPLLADGRVDVRLATDRPACVSGRYFLVWLLEETDDTDCDATAGGSTPVLCKCEDGTYSAIGSGGGGGGALLYTNSSVPAGNTVDNTATESAFSSSYDVPADTLIADEGIRVILRGVYSTPAAAIDLTIKVKVDGVTFASFVADQLPNAASDAGWLVDEIITVRTAGASGDAEHQGFSHWGDSGAPGPAPHAPSTGLASIDTTQDLTITATAEWASADPDASVTLRQVVIEHLTATGGGGGGGGSGDITSIFDDDNGDVSVLRAESDDEFDMSAGASSIVAPQSTTLPANCSQGEEYHDTNATLTSTERWVCTATDTWTPYQNVKLDLADDASEESAAVEEIATDDDLLGAATEPSANKLLLNVHKVRHISHVSVGSINGDLDDWAPTGIETADLVRITSCTTVTAWRLTGIDADQTDGRLLTVANLTTNCLFISASEDTDSSASNRIVHAHRAPRVLMPGEKMNLWYDGTSSRWRTTNDEPFRDTSAYWVQTYYGGNPLTGNSESMWGSRATNGSETVRETLFTGAYASAAVDALNDVYIIGSNTGFGPNSLGPDRGLLRWQATFRLLTNLSSSTERFIVRIGFYDGTGNSDGTDGIYFKYSDNLLSGDWQCVAIDNTSPTTADSNIPATTNNVHLLIDHIPDRDEADFYINGVRVCTVTGTPSGTSRVFGAYLHVYKTVDTANAVRTQLVMGWRVEGFNEGPWN